MSNDRDFLWKQVGLSLDETFGTNEITVSDYCKSISGQYAGHNQVGKSSHEMATEL